MILIPVKNLGHAKQRLASILDQPSRTELAQAMLRDVLGTLAEWGNRPPVALVTSDPLARDLAQEFGFEIIEDVDNRGETAAIEMATTEVMCRGAKWTLVIPADIPLIKAVDVDRVIRSAPHPGTVLVPAADGRGTNAALRSPAALFPLRFGNDSFKPHLATARSTGYPCNVIEFASIALDVDRPADLLQLATAPGNSRSQQLVRRWNLREEALVS